MSAPEQVPPPVPGPVWAAAAVAAALRALPFVATLLRTPAPDEVQLPVPYAAQDWLAYVALIRQGPGLLANPFTTEPQSNRLVLLLHQALGGIHALTGADAFWLLELSRIPLLALFTLVLWRLVAHVHAERAVRIWACALVLFSGGLGYAARPYVELLDEGGLRSLSWSLHSGNGWSTFEAISNPAWTAGLTLAMLALRPLLQPGGPANRREAAVAGGAFLAAWLVHPYSAVAIAVAAAGGTLSAWISSEPDTRGRLLGAATALAPALLVYGALVAWQRRDPSFAAAAGGFFGKQNLPVAWYPLTLAALGLFALQGLRRLAAERSPWRHGLAGWIGAIALLHSSNLVNGYHFVFALHLPLALAAAGPVAAFFAGRADQGRRRAAGLVVGALLFGSALGTTLDDIGGAADHVMPKTQAQLLSALAKAPPGPVMAPPLLGNLVPAFTPDRVYVGHWFMTPGYDARSQEYARLASGEMGLEEARRLLSGQGIRYLIVPADRAPRLLAGLGLPAAAAATFGDLVLASLW